MARKEVTRQEREKAAHYEMCACGHARADHFDRFGAIDKGLVGHAACDMAGCTCKKYTWTPRTHAPTPV